MRFSKNIKAFIIISLSIILYFIGDATLSKGIVKIPKGCMVVPNMVGKGLTGGSHGLIFQYLPQINNGQRDKSFAFNILDKGTPVGNFALSHTKPLHLILLSTDDRFYYHLHPVYINGLWSATLPKMIKANYQAYIDFDYKNYNFVLKGYIGELGSDAQSSYNTFPDYKVVTNSTYNTKSHNMMLFLVTYQGKSIPLESYLGVAGHIVGIRASSGEYVHFHTLSSSAMNQCPSYLMPMMDSGLAEDLKEGVIHFMSSFPGRGRYYIFMQFSVRGLVVTKSFTAMVN